MGIESKKINLIALVSPYFNDVSVLGSDSERMDAVSEVYFNIFGNKEISDLIWSVKEHNWVGVVEGRQKIFNLNFDLNIKLFRPLYYFI